MNKKEKSGALFEITILGCGSAKPTLRHHTTSQIVCLKGVPYMIDCGEGTQVQLIRYKIHTGKLDHIFISHSHGDHCLGLAGLLSSLALDNRCNDLHLHVPADLEPMLQAQIDFFVQHRNFDIRIHPISCQQPTEIFEDNNVKVTAFPLDHRVPCYGFLFQEQSGDRHIKSECIRQYGIPYDAIRSIQHGQDFTTANGQVIPNSELTTPPAPTRSYAYLSDTLVVPQYAELLQNVDLLYHDATYCAGDEELAYKYYHATSKQAAEFAKSCNVRKLLLGHFSSRYKDENRLLEHATDVFPDTLLADEGLTVAIGG